VEEKETGKSTLMQNTMIYLQNNENGRWLSDACGCPILAEQRSNANGLSSSAMGQPPAVLPSTTENEVFEICEVLT
jgi:hypothetical protein